MEANMERYLRYLGYRPWLEKHPSTPPLESWAKWYRYEGRRWDFTDARGEPIKTNTGFYLSDLEVWPGLIDRLLGRSFSIEDSFGVSRVYFETVTLVTFGAMILLAVVFWLLGRRDIRSGAITDTDLLEKPLEEALHEDVGLSQEPAEVA
jgi:hypothetical protein